MKEFTYTIQDPLGLHARPAGLLVKKAKEYNSSIMLKCGEKTADLKKIFSVMGLAIKTGESVAISVEGDDETDAAAALEAFLHENL